MSDQLRDRRRRLLNPHTLLNGLLDHLETQARLFEAIGSLTQDDRWQAVADALHATTKSLGTIAWRRASFF